MATKFRLVTADEYQTAKDDKVTKHPAGTVVAEGVVDAPFAFKHLDCLLQMRRLRLVAVDHSAVNSSPNGAAGPSAAAVTTDAAPNDAETSGKSKRK